MANKLSLIITAQLWRNVEIWLRKNVEATIRLSEKEKIFGIQEKGLDSYIINMVIINTKIVLWISITYI